MSHMVLYAACLAVPFVQDSCWTLPLLPVKIADAGQMVHTDTWEIGRVISLTGFLISLGWGAIWGVWVDGLYLGFLGESE